MPTNIGSMDNKNKRTNTNSKRPTNEMKESAKTLSRREKERKLLEELGSEQPGMNKRKKIAIGATAGVLGVAAVLIPTVKYFIDNQKHIITMKVLGTNYETYKLEVKKGSLIKELKTYTITGYNFVGFFKDEACTIPYTESERVTKSSTVFCKYAPTTYTISYPTNQEGYIVNAEPEIEYGNKFIFTVNILDDYNKSNYIVKVNGEIIESNEYGQYIIDFVETNINITVENVVKNKPIMSLNFGETTIDFEIEEDATLNDVLTENETLIKTQVIAETLKNNPNTYTQEQLDALSLTDLMSVTTSGIYTDETCTEEIDLTKSLVEYGKETTIHTEFATLDKLSISDSAAKAKDTSISGEVVIPLSYLDSNGVKTEITSIPKSAFSNCKELTKVVIGNSVIHIGDGAFYKCTGLTEITISKSVEKIDGSNAFVNCSNLKKTNYLGDINSWVQIEFFTPPSNPIFASKNLYINGQLVTTANIDTATKINSWCFYNLASLKNVIFGKNITSIPTSIFQTCTGLESLEVDSENAKYHSAGNCIIETASKTLILGYKNSIIPTDGTVARIGAYSFYNCAGLTSITIPDSVTNIEASAFYGCKNLKEVEFKNTSGWWRSTSSSATSGTTISSSDLYNKTTAATYLKSTYSYQYWKRT